MHGLRRRGIVDRRRWLTSATEGNGGTTCSVFVDTDHGRRPRDLADLTTYCLRGQCIHECHERCLVCHDAASAGSLTDAADGRVRAVDHERGRIEADALRTGRRDGTLLERPSVVDLRIRLAVGQEERNLRDLRRPVLHLVEHVGHTKERHFVVGRSQRHQSLDGLEHRLGRGLPVADQA